MPHSTEFSEPGSTRRWLVTHFADTSELASQFEQPAASFVFLLALDASSVSDAELRTAATAVLKKGARYACCWGPAAERAHTAFDLASADLDLNAKTVIMTTAHEDEPLEEAVWFATHAAYPAPGYEDAFDVVVCASVAHEEWFEAMKTYLSAGAPMRDEA